MHQGLSSRPLLTSTWSTVRSPATLKAQKAVDPCWEPHRPPDASARAARAASQGPVSQREARCRSKDHSPRRRSGRLLRGTVGLVVRGCFPQLALCGAWTPTPRHLHRQASDSRGSRAPRGRFLDQTPIGTANKPRAGSRVAAEASTLGLTDFVGQFIRHVGGASARNDELSEWGRTARGRDLRLAPASLNIFLFEYS